jgi:hypothetical protein
LNAARFIYEKSFLLTPGHITFENPDAIIAVETIANWAGLSLWTRWQLKRYPLIRVE